MVGFNVGTILGPCGDGSTGRLQADYTSRHEERWDIQKPTMRVKRGVKRLRTTANIASPIALDLHFSRASSEAIAAVETTAGGQVTSIFTTIPWRSARISYSPKKYNDTRCAPNMLDRHHKRGISGSAKMRAWFEKQKNNKNNTAMMVPLLLLLLRPRDTG